MPALFAGMAAVLAVLALLLTAMFLRAEPVVLKAPEEAVQTVDSFMAAVCEGDFQSAQLLLSGTPDLGADQTPSDPAAALIWEAFLDSTDYTLEGSCYAVDSGLAQDVLFLSLDISSVTQNLGPRAAQLLEQKVSQAEDVSEVYDADNNYREDLVMEVLQTVTREAIREDARYIEQRITLKLTSREGRWQILPEQQLLNTLFGGIG